MLCKTHLQQSANAFGEFFLETVDTSLVDLKTTITVVRVCVLQMETLERQRPLEREQLDTMDRKLRSQERLLAVKDATIAELELRLTAVEQTSYDGTLLWRITDFQRKRQDAITGRVTSIYSPPFFTSRTGKLDVFGFL